MDIKSKYGNLGLQGGVKQPSINDDFKVVLSRENKLGKEWPLEIRH
jgi:hypothetical protein